MQITHSTTILPDAQAAPLSSSLRSEDGDNTADVSGGASNTVQLTLIAVIAWVAVMTLVFATSTLVLYRRQKRRRRSSSDEDEEEDEEDAVEDIGDEEDMTFESQSSQDDRVSVISETPSVDLKDFEMPAQVHLA